MPSTMVFDVPLRADRIVEYLAHPRHLVIANHQGPIVDGSAGPTTTGSWYVMAMDQLRVRVDYRAFEPQRVVEIDVTGRLSLGTRRVLEFVLAELPGGAGTRVSMSMESAGGWWMTGPLARVSMRLYWRRLRRGIEASE